MDQSASWEIEKNLSENGFPLDLVSEMNCTELSDFAARSFNNELRELKWQDGQIAMHGLERSIKSIPAKYTWEKPIRSGTLESIVHQATELASLKTQDHDDELFQLFNHPEDPMAHLNIFDVLVPSSISLSTPFVDQPKIDLDYNDQLFETGTSTHVGESTSFDQPQQKEIRQNHLSSPQHLIIGKEGCSSINPNMSFSETFTRNSSRHPSVDETFTRDNSTCPGVDSSGMDVGKDFASTSKDVDSNLNSFDNIHDSVSNTRLEKQTRIGSDKSGQKSRISTRRRKAAAIHNQSERKRRDKINQKMSALQKLVPNSHKVDKSSMLDEIIEYVKSLQLQVNMMSRVPPMVMPFSVPQLHMSMMAQMGMHGLGMSMGAMDMNSMGHPPMAGMSPVMNPATFMHMPPWNGLNDPMAPSTSGMVPDPRAAFLACQAQQPMAMDPYGRMVPFYQQQQQQQQQQQHQPQQQQQQQQQEQQIPTTNS